MAQVNTAIQKTLGSIDKDLSASLGKKQDEFDHWHSKIRESAKSRQVEQTRLDDMKCKPRERVELDRQIKNLEESSQALESALKELTAAGDDGVDATAPEAPGPGDADKIIDDVDMAQFESLFPESFDPSSAAAGFSDEQTAFLSSLPSPTTLQSRLRSYDEHNASMRTEVEDLKSKNVVLGENYRRMVIACTGWSAEQVDEAADGLTECVKDLNENPLPEDVAIEILMKDRGQDW